MLIFPNTKINLGLYITEKRGDGYHNLYSCFYPILWQEALEIVPADSFSLTCSGLPIPGETTDNLCTKAYQLLAADFDLSPVQVYLHKTVPTGTGLGAGSANGAFMLKLLNQYFELNLSDTELAAYALQLGSDCPFFILNQPAVAQGRGETLSAIPTVLSGKYIQLVCPGIHISTAEAYRSVTPNIPEISLAEVLQQPIETWKHTLRNDFEAWAISQNPFIGELKEMLYAEGAAYAAMSGSGSAVFGIFNEVPPPLALQNPAITVWSGKC